MFWLLPSLSLSTSLSQEMTCSQKYLNSSFGESCSCCPWLNRPSADWPSDLQPQPDHACCSQFTDLPAFMADCLIEPRSESSPEHHFCGLSLNSLDGFLPPVAGHLGEGVLLHSQLDITDAGACSELCNAHAGCLSFDYNWQSKTCKLNRAASNIQQVTVDSHVDGEMPTFHHQRKLQQGASCTAESLIPATLVIERLEMSLPVPDDELPEWKIVKDGSSYTDEMLASGDHMRIISGGLGHELNRRCMGDTACDFAAQGIEVLVGSHACQALVVQSHSIVVCDVPPLLSTDEGSYGKSYSIRIRDNNCTTDVLAEVGHQVCRGLECNAHQTLNAQTCECQCLPDWRGFDCDLCASDAVCAADDSLKGVCDSKSADYHHNTGVKTYNCQTENNVGLVNSTLEMRCEMGGGRCELAFELPLVSDEDKKRISCNMSDCDFNTRSNKFICKYTECETRVSGAPTKTIIQKSSDFECDPDGDEDDVFACYLAVDHFLISLGGNAFTTNCMVAECVSEVNYGLLVWVPYVIAISVFLVLGLCCLGVAVLVNMQIKKKREAMLMTARGGSKPMVTPRGDDGQLLTPRSTARLEKSHLKLEFESVICQVKAKKGSSAKQLLHGVSGELQKGSSLALMGPSGCGKTTLLNILGNNIGPSLSWAGKVRLDGVDKELCETWEAGYVQQEDILLETLTVEECVAFSAALRLPRSSSKKERAAAVHNVLTELKLDKFAQSQVGNPHTTKILSGGQMRRLSIAMEVVVSPTLLLLDEPTTGLDSNAAKSVVKTLLKLAKKDRYVIFSIHQPSLEVYMCLDQVMLMAKGHKIFNGPASETEGWFEMMHMPCPEGLNIADHMLDMVVDFKMFKEIKEKLQLTSIQVEFQETSPFLQFCNSLLTVRSVRTVSWEQVCLLQRSMRHITRHPSLLRSHLFLGLILAVVSGAIFYDVSDDLAGFQNRVGAIYFALSFFAFSSLSVISLFIDEKSLFTRETSAKYYTTLTYFIAKVSLDVLFLRIVPAALFSCIFYYMMGLQPDYERFTIFTLTLSLVNMLTGAFCICMSVIGGDAGSANLLSTVLLLLFLLFGGFLLNAETMPAYVKWIGDISFFAYAFEILMCNELEGLEIQISAPDYPPIIVPGSVFMDTLGMDPDNIGPNITIMLWMTFGYYFLAFFLLSAHGGTVWNFVMEKITCR